MNTIRLITDNELWQRIADFSIDKPDVAFPFSKKLAKEENWTLDFTKKAIEEYKKFVYLCCILPNGASPSEIVDKVWHMHLIYTQNYWEEFCPNVLQRKLHHHPSMGGFNENIKHRNWFSDTLKSYEDIFQQKAPEEFWKPQNRKAKRKFWTTGLKIFSLLTVVFLLNSCSHEVTSIFFTGVVIFFALIFILGIIGAAFGENDVTNLDKKNKNTDGTGSDGGCGGGASCSGGGSCGGGCGGGCGGCGGGCGG